MNTPHFVAYVYRISKVNVIFALSSILLLIFFVWMIWQDYDREWKHFQREANRLEIAKTEAEKAQAAQGIDSTRLVQLESDLKAARADLERQRWEIDAARAEVDRITRRRLYKADQDARFAKADYDVLRYEYEEAARHHGEAGAARQKAKMEAKGREVERLKIELEGVERERAQAEARLVKGTARRDEVERQIAALEKETIRLSRKLAAIGPNFFNAFFRNQPLMDFLAPSEKVQQVVARGVLDDVNFVRVPKADRCQTCHVNIDRPGYEADPETGLFQDEATRAYVEKTYPDSSEQRVYTRVFATHPKLDLFLGGRSPHPVEKIGCTVCHLGRGRGTSFISVAHTPKNEEEAKAWEERYGWHKLHHGEGHLLWDYPMLPMVYAEAMCAKCHKGVVEVPKAHQLNRGRELVEALGCFGCHKIKGYEGLRKVGPSLMRVGGKLEQAWVARWVHNPKAFRPASKMPRIFDLSNTDGPEDRARNAALINGIAAYLFEHTERPSYPAPPVAGSAVQGRMLVEKAGCRGCHVVGEGDEAERPHDYRNFGPNLNGMGSKVKAGWLFAWLKDPHDYFPGTRMPNLRLTDQEAADIAAYLMGLKNPSFEARPAPRTEGAARDELALFFLRARMTDSQARTELARMSNREKDLFLGERAITRQGCFGCHDIKGFENAQQVGTELTEEGDKDVGRLDFGFIEIPETRHDWFFQKLKDPRIFDRGKVKTYDEKLRMPQFDLTDEDARAVTLALMSFTRDDVPMESRKNLTPRETEVARGQRLVRDHNCRGCHIVEEAGGAIRPSVAKVYAAEQGLSEEDALAFSPPALHGEGAKTQPDWLFGFLKGPVPIRPWLSARMPTFGFSDEEAADVVRYFSALDRQPFPYETIPPRRMTAEGMQAAQKLFSKDYFSCLSCHQQGAIKPLGDPSRWAPDLALARERLRPRWIVTWLQDPQKVQPGTKMPSFFLDPSGVPPDVLNGDMQKQIQVLADYIVYGMHQRSASAGSGADRLAEGAHQRR